MGLYPEGAKGKRETMRERERQREGEREEESEREKERVPPGLLSVNLFFSGFRSLPWIVKFYTINEAHRQYIMKSIGQNI